LKSSFPLNGFGQYQYNVQSQVNTTGGYTENKQYSAIKFDLVNVADLKRFGWPKAVLQGMYMPM